MAKRVGGRPVGEDAENRIRLWVPREWLKRDTYYCKCEVVCLNRGKDRGTVCV